LFVCHGKELGSCENNGLRNVVVSGVTGSDADHGAMKIQATLLTHCQVTSFLRHFEGSA
jgi:hypothetical protein